MKFGNIPKKVLYHKINPDPCYDDTPMRLIDALKQLNEDVVFAQWSWNEREKNYLDSFTVWTTNKVAFLNHFLNEQYLATLPRNPPGE